MSRRLVIVAAATWIGILWLAAITCALLGIWNFAGHGGEWAGTAFLAFVCGIPGGAVLAEAAL